MKKLLLATAASAFLALPAFAQYNAAPSPSPAPMQPAQPAPTATMRPAAPMRTARMSARQMRPTGLSSTEIRQIQTALNRDGFKAGRVDGMWGPRTRTALENFQRSRGMTPTGMVNHQTLADLRIGPSRNAQRTRTAATPHRAPAAMKPAPKPAP